MINPAEITNSLVALLRDIPELVEELGGDAERIFPYHDSYPQKVSLALAIYQAPSPSVMVAWQGGGLGSFGGFEAYKHRFSIFLRAGENFADDPPTAYYRLLRLIMKGKPTNGSQPMSNATVHPSCHPMEVADWNRQTDSEGIDYFEMSVSFTEIGDD